MTDLNTPLRSLLCYLGFFTLCACSPYQANRNDIAPNTDHFAGWYNSTFTHGIWYNQAALNERTSEPKPPPPRGAHTPSGARTIYIHGDGLPWLAPNKIASDPSPDYALTWSLFQLDPQPALFIGRPCYFGALQIDSQCQPRLWTNARYATEVVQSIAHTIMKIAAENGNQDFTLIGYSGGGTLAVLVAAELSRSAPHLISRVVTVAANLDTQKWATHHRYSPLSSSLNPSDLLPSHFAPHLTQIHFCGLKDRNTSIELTQGFFDRQNVRCTYIDAGHQKGWVEAWPAILTRLQKH